MFLRVVKIISEKTIFIAQTNYLFFPFLMKRNMYMILTEIKLKSLICFFFGMRQMNEEICYSFQLCTLINSHTNHNQRRYFLSTKKRHFDF